jgi:hypothetical protein
MCVLISTVGRVFIESWGSSTDLEKSVWHQVVAGRQGGAALHRLSLPPWHSTPHVDTCPQSCGSNRHKTWSVGQGVWSVGRPWAPFGLGFDPLAPCVKCIPVVMMILIFDQLYFIIP